MTNELLPCPFCGSAAQEPESGFMPLENILYTWCTNPNCYLCPIGRDERLFTIKQWNTRTQATDSTVREPAGEGDYEWLYNRIEGEFGESHDVTVEVKELIELNQNNKSRDVDEWFLIETAPKDKRIILYSKSWSLNDGVVIGRWNNNYWQVECDDDYTVHFEPTHWQHMLPDPEGK